MTTKSDCSFDSEREVPPSLSLAACEHLVWAARFGMTTVLFTYARAVKYPTT